MASLHVEEQVAGSPIAKLRLDVRTPSAAEVTALEFVRDADDDWLAVADHGGGLCMIKVERHENADPRSPNHVRDLQQTAQRYGLPVAYDLAFLPRQTQASGLVAVGQRTLAFDAEGRRLAMSITSKDETTSLAVEALAGTDGLPIVAVGGKDLDRHADVYLYSGEPGEKAHHIRELQDEGVGAVRALKALRLERHLVVAHDAGCTVWDLSRGLAQARTVCRFGSGTSRSVAAYYDAQGRARLATASWRGIQTWDPSSAGSGHPLSGFARAITATAIVAVMSDRGDPQLAVGHGHEVSLWSMTTEMPEGTPVGQLPGQVKRVAKSPLTNDGTTLLAAADDIGNVRVWELPRVQPTTRPYGRHSRWVNALVDIGKDNPLRIASASDDRTIQLWPPEPGPAGLPMAPDHHPASVQALAVPATATQPDPANPAVAASPDLLVSGDEAGCVRVWSLPGRELLRERRLGGKVRAVVVLRDEAGRRLVVAGGAALSIGAGAPAPMVVFDTAGDADDVPQFRYEGATGDTLIRALAVQSSPDGVARLVAAGDSHGRVTVWNAATRELVRTDTSRHSGPVRALAWVSTVAGPRLASGGNDGFIHLWAENLTTTTRFDGHRGPVASLAALSAAEDLTDGQVHLFVSGGADGTIRTWDPDQTGETGQPRTPVGVLPAHPSWVRTLLRLEHAGVLYVVSGGDDGTIRQWVLTEGRLRSTRHEGRLSGFGDRPAQYDLLGRESLEAVLVALLRLPVPPAGVVDGAGTPRRPSDMDRGVPTNGPRVIALQGAWGAGKTSIMRRIYTELRRYDHTCTAWHSDHDCVRAHRVEAAPGGTRRRGWRRRGGPEARPDADQAVAARLTVRAAVRLTRGTGGAGPAQPPVAGSAPTRVLPVWFNPWAHKSADEVWAGLTQQIMDAACTAMCRGLDGGAATAQWHRYWLTRNLGRLDGGEIRRVLLRRIWLPLLPLFLAVLPLAAAALRAGWMWPALIGYAALVAVIMTIVAIRWWYGNASAYLPADILEGPVLSGAFATTRPTAEPLLHDPLYQARSGYLYLVQHDVKHLIADLAQRQFQLVVFIDDLDRCPPGTLAQVFEAVNIFLAEDFSSAKFVIGLDPSVVSGRLTEVFGAEESRLWHYPDDPHPGWSFLRKLCQLTVTLPEIREAHTARLMRLHTPAPEPVAKTAAEFQPSMLFLSFVAAWLMQRRRRRANDPAPARGVLPDEAAAEEPASQPHPADDGLSAESSTQDSPIQDRSTRDSPPADGQAPPGPAGDTVSPPSPDAGATPDATAEHTMLLFEGDPVVQDHLRALMALRPHQSVRETKRLLTLWSFYLRLLRRLLPEDATSSAQFGRDVLTFAEVLTRWPALVPALGPAASAESGLRDLIDAARADARQEYLWLVALRRLGLDGPEFAAPCANLRTLLARHGNDEVAYYAECVL